jgi:hypothetical protein
MLSRWWGLEMGLFHCNDLGVSWWLGFWEFVPFL